MEVEFTSENQYVVAWGQVLEGLCKSQLGATLQDRMAVFGSAVEEKLEAMLDDWPMEYFEGQFFEQDENRFRIGFITASDGEEFAEKRAMGSGLTFDTM